MTRRKFCRSTHNYPTSLVFCHCLTKSEGKSPSRKGSSLTTKRRKENLMIYWRGGKGQRARSMSSRPKKSSSTKLKRSWRRKKRKCKGWREGLRNSKKQRSPLRLRSKLCSTLPRYLTTSRGSSTTTTSRNRTARSTRRSARSTSRTNATCSSMPPFSTTTSLRFPSTTTQPKQRNSTKLCFRKWAASSPFSTRSKTLRSIPWEFATLSRICSSSSRKGMTNSKDSAISKPTAFEASSETWSFGWKIGSSSKTSLPTSRSYLWWLQSRPERK